MRCVTGKAFAWYWADLAFNFKQSRRADRDALAEDLDSLLDDRIRRG
jgi:hypothetical protein